MSKAVAKKESNLPTLAHTPAMEITAEDVALPRMKVGQYMTEQVKQQSVQFGDLFVSLGEDDPDPIILASLGDEKGAIIHVLDMYKGKSLSEGGELTLYDYDDPAAPPEAWVTYNYTVAIPEADDYLPCKWMLTRTGRTTAQQINTILKKNEAAGPAYVNAFEVTTIKRENAKGEFAVPRVRLVEAEPKNIEIASKMAEIISGRPAPAAAASPTDEPAI